MRHDATADFLLELLSEEIPARMQARARNDLARMFAEALAAAGLVDRRDHDLLDPAPAGADRARPAARDRGGARGTQGPAQLGAAAGARRLPAQDRADAGPARRARRHLVRADRQARPRHRRSARRGRRRDRPRFPLAQVDALGRGVGLDRSLRWVRPLHSIVALLGEEIVPVAIDGVACGAATLGHRFHHPGADHHRRRARLCREIARLPRARRPGRARGDRPRRARSRPPRMPASCWSRTRGWWSRMPG